jgi:23S rRNA (cytidine2498-2'-O)-methyltransferase
MRQRLACALPFGYVHVHVHVHLYVHVSRYVTRVSIPAPATKARDQGYNASVVLQGSTVFLFCVCQASGETILKSEVAREHPDLRPAYSRPGFVTFKLPDDQGIPDDPVKAASFQLRSVFSRVHGVSLGRLDGQPTSDADLAREVVSIAVGLGIRPLRLHVFERDRHLPGDEPDDFDNRTWPEAFRKAILEVAASSASDPASSDKPLFHRASTARPGDLVLDVIRVEPGETWLGMHRQDREGSPHAGGRTPLVSPPDAPSRAWLKFEESLAWSHLPMRKDDLALELGSAPGGATWAMLNREIHVIGVDTGTMDPRVLSFNGRSSFTLIPKSFRTLVREDLPLPINWLLMDLNVSPGMALGPVERIVSWMRRSLMGALLTLKMNDASQAEKIPAFLERVRLTGLLDVRAAQLSSHRREIVVAGLTEAGRQRVKG